MPSLERRLLDAKGTSVTLLSEARTACRGAPGFHAELIGFCGDPRPEVADGATWILKAELEDGARLPPELTAQLVAALPGLPSWAAALHLCQSVDRLDLTHDQAVLLSSWARGLAGHKRPFVRAWAAHARVALGRRFDGLRADGAAALAAAEQDPAASVRARARQLRNTL